MPHAEPPEGLPRRSGRQTGRRVVEISQMAALDSVKALGARRRHAPKNSKGRLCERVDGVLVRRVGTIVADRGHITLL